MNPPIVSSSDVKVLTLQSLETDFKPAWTVNSGQLKNIIRNTEPVMLNAIKKPLAFHPSIESEPDRNFAGNSESNDNTRYEAHLANIARWESRERGRIEANNQILWWFNRSLTFGELITYIKDILANKTQQYMYKVIDYPPIKDLVKSVSTENPKTARLFIIFKTSNEVLEDALSFVIYEDKDGENLKKRRVFLHVTNLDMIESIKKHPQSGGRRRSSRKNYKKSPKRVFAAKSRRIRRQRK